MASEPDGAASTDDRPLTLGLDLGGTKCLGLALDRGGEIVDELRLPTPREPGGILDVLTTVAERLRQSVSAVGSVVGVGVGAPGLVDREGVLRAAPNLVAARQLALGAELTERLGLPVYVDNDATCATWGEREHGAAHRADDVVMVTLGTGIGGGIIADGRLYRGSNGFAGEIGHMVVDPHGPLCPCGQHGCWERYASGSGLGRFAREAAEAGQGARMMELAGGDPEAVRGEHATRAAKEGDEQARAVLAHFAWWLALGLANLANIFDPELFVIGGGLVEAGAPLFDPAREAFRGLVEAADERPEIGIVPALLGERAGAIGAAALAREHATPRSAGTTT